MERRLRNSVFFLAFFALMILMLPSIFSVNAAATSCTLDLPVTVEVTSDASSMDKIFTVEIFGEDEDAPMPDEAVLSFTESGTQSFSGFEFTELKDYHYTVKQTTAIEPGYTLDTNEYEVTVRIINSPYTEGEYLAEVWLTQTEDETKPTEIRFNNSFTQASVAITKTCRLLGDRIRLDYDFYCALFADAAGTQRVSSIKVFEIRISNDGKYIVKFENLPAGTYYFFETDAQGNVIGDSLDGFRISLEGCQGREFTVTDEDRYFEMWLVNDFMEKPPTNYDIIPEDPDNPVPRPSITPVPSESPSSPTPSTSNVPTTPTTGDNTNLSLYLIIGVISLAVLVLLIIIKIKLGKKNK